MAATRSLVSARRISPLNEEAAAPPMPQPPVQHLFSFCYLDPLEVPAHACQGRLYIYQGS